MKPKFRDIADRQLSDVKFTDSMKLYVLVHGRRRFRRVSRSILAAACACLLLACALLLRFGVRHSFPDTVVSPGNMSSQSFSSQHCTVTITGCRWNGHKLSIDYAVTSNAGAPALIIRSPFYTESDALVEDSESVYFKAYAEEALYICPGETLELTSQLRAEDCHPGQTIAINLRVDMLAPVIDVLRPEELPASADGPFLVKLDERRVDIISGTRQVSGSSGSVSGSATEYIDYPTAVWTSTLDRSYASLPIQLVRDGVASDREKVEVCFTITAPASYVDSAMIRSGATSGNGLFSVEIDLAYFCSDSTELSLTITPEKPLLRKDSRTFFVRFTSADGELVKTFELTPWMLPAADGDSDAIRCYFDRTLDFTPDEVAVICEWSGGGASGSAEAVFARKQY